MLAPAVAPRAARPRRDRARGGRAGRGERRHVRLAALVPVRSHGPVARRLSFPIGRRSSTAAAGAAGRWPAVRRRRATTSSCGGPGGEVAVPPPGHRCRREPAQPPPALPPTSSRPAGAAPLPHRRRVGRGRPLPRARLRRSRFGRDADHRDACSTTSTRRSPPARDDAPRDRVVLPALAALGLWVVRIGLRPLERRSRRRRRDRRRRPLAAGRAGRAATRRSAASAWR